MAKFTKKNVDATELIDPVFYAAANCNRAIEKYGKENVINATIGTLYDEDNNLVALKTVYGTYDSIDPKEKAAYAKSFAGNPDFRRQAYKWVTQGSNVNLCHRAVRGRLARLFHQFSTTATLLFCQILPGAPIGRCHRQTISKRQNTGCLTATAST